MQLINLQLLSKSHAARPNRSRVISKSLKLYTRSNYTTIEMIAQLNQHAVSNALLKSSKMNQTTNISAGVIS